MKPVRPGDGRADRADRHADRGEIRIAMSIGAGFALPASAWLRIRRPWLVPAVDALSAAAANFSICSDHPHDALVGRPEGLRGR